MSGQHSSESDGSPQFHRKRRLESTSHPVQPYSWSVI